MKTPKEECEQLLDAFLPFAEEMLSKHREFYPFGGALGVDGEIKAVAGGTDDEQPSSVEVIDVLEDGFRAGAAKGEYRATAIVIDVRTVPPGKSAKQDAIAVRLDHRDDYSVEVFFPYSFGPGGELRLEAPFATPGEGRIFRE